jgi:hypothetical protein
MKAAFELYGQFLLNRACLNFYFLVQTKFNLNQVCTKTEY